MPRAYGLVPTVYAAHSPVQKLIGHADDLQELGANRLKTQYGRGEKKDTTLIHEGRSNVISHENWRVYSPLNACTCSDPEVAAAVVTALNFEDEPPVLCDTRSANGDC